MKTVLIVLNYNDYETTELLLNNAIKIEKIEQIIVVDNCSTDNSYEKLKKRENSKIDVIRTSDNGGYSSGNNFGIRYAIKHYSPKYLLIANPDVKLNEQCVGGILDFYEEMDHERIGIVTCKTSEEKIYPAWKLPKYRDCIWENLILLRKLLHIKDSAYDEKKLLKQEYSQVDVISGAFFAIAADVMLDVGMFDEDTFLFYEENILGFRLKEKQYKNYVLNKYEYVHNHSVSIQKNIKSIGKKMDLGFESRSLYLDKYLRVGKIRKLFHACTYRLGKFNYLLTKNIVNKMR